MFAKIEGAVKSYSNSSQLNQGFQFNVGMQASEIYGLLMNLFLAACEVSNTLPTTMTGAMDSTMDNTTTDNGMYCCASKLCVSLFLVSRPNHDESVSKGNLDRVIGASLSEPHTSVTALPACVCIYLSIYACLDRPLPENFK